MLYAPLALLAADFRADVVSPRKTHISFEVLRGGRVPPTFHVYGHFQGVTHNSGLIQRVGVGKNTRTHTHTLSTRGCVFELHTSDHGASFSMI